MTHEHKHPISTGVVHGNSMLLNRLEEYNLNWFWRILLADKDFQEPQFGFDFLVLPVLIQHWDPIFFLYVPVKRKKLKFQLNPPSCSKPNTEAASGSYFRADKNITGSLFTNNRHDIIFQFIADETAIIYKTELKTQQHLFSTLAAA